MPVSPDLASGLAQTTLDLYTDAERALLARIARHIAAGMDSPQWAEEKLLAVQTIRQYAATVLAQLQEQATGTITKAIQVAGNRGAAAGVADLQAVLGGRLEDYADPIATSEGRAPAEQLIEETVSKVASTHGRVLRSTVDVYRDVIARATAQTLLGTETRRATAQRALDEFASRGVTGFIDRAGRGWDLASYVEMAVRTATARATVNAHADRLRAYGEDLVIVSDAPQECQLCRPWEGKVLSLSGSTAGHVDGSGRGARVAGTLEQARDAGLFHPGCRHSTSLYQPGITKAPTDTEDVEGDHARQHLRHLERKVRQWKRRRAVALDDRAEFTADAKIQRYQREIQHHVATTSAKRQRHREQIGSAR